MNNIFCSFHFSYRRSSQVSASAYPESGQSKRRQSVFQIREKWQYLTWEVSLGSTNARPNCHKGVGPGRLQVLHHIRQVQGNGEHQGQEGAVLASQATHLVLIVLGCATIPKDDFKVLGVEKATTDEDNEEGTLRARAYWSKIRSVDISIAHSNCKN